VDESESPKPAADEPPQKEVTAHAVAETAPPSEDVAGAALDAAEAEGAVADATPPVGEGHEAPERLRSIIESLLFASDKPLGVKRLQDLVRERNLENVVAAVETLRADYADRGVVLHEVAGGFQFRTHPLNAHWVQQLVAGKPVKLSRAQLETLAIVAYRQPITRPEIEEIRGVDSGSTVKTLLDRGLIRVLGKKEEPGRPMLYGTSRDFLEFFHLKDLKELPTLREFYELSEESMAKVRELDERRQAEAQTAAPPPTEPGREGQT
jgi:segregation and condensation protein B